MTHKFVIKLKQASYNVLRNFTATRVHRHVIEKFVKKTGLIYFGAVDQMKDEHRLIRGFTASSTHRDNHFSVGTIDDYDVSLVDRSDMVIRQDDSIETSNWLIVAIDLKNGGDIPHIFIKANNHEDKSYETLFVTYPTFAKIKLGTFESYPIDFTTRFSIFTTPADVIEVEKLLPADSMRVLGAHLWPYSIEINDGTVYLYSDDENITQNNLTTMLNVGLWVARHLDSMINQI